MDRSEEKQSAQLFDPMLYARSEHRKHSADPAGPTKKAARRSERGEECGFGSRGAGLGFSLTRDYFGFRIQKMKVYRLFKGFLLCRRVWMFQASDLRRLLSV